MPFNFNLNRNSLFDGLFSQEDGGLAVIIMFLNEPAGICIVAKLNEKFQFVTLGPAETNGVYVQAVGELFDIFTVYFVCAPNFSMEDGLFMNIPFEQVVIWAWAFWEMKNEPKENRSGKINREKKIFFTEIIIMANPRLL